MNCEKHFLKSLNIQSVVQGSSGGVGSAIRTLLAMRSEHTTEPPVVTEIQAIADGLASDATAAHSAAAAAAAEAALAEEALRYIEELERTTDASHLGVRPPVLPGGRAR